MKKYKITFRPQAEVDLFKIYAYIAEHSDRTTAAGYIGRIHAACRDLAIFPERGARRDRVRRGLRVIGFEKRAAIVFQVTRTEVVIVRIFYGGRDYERLLGRG